MTNSQILGTIEATNPVLTVAPSKEETEMLGATNKITALYCRLSQEDERLGESLSIENQRMMLEAYARQNHFTNISCFVDDGYSGVDFQRPGFQKMLEAIESDQVSTVIVKDLSRFSRNSAMSGMLINFTFAEHGVRFIAINDDVDSENSRAGDDIIIPVKNIMNEAYCRELSKKLRRQFQIQRGNGEFLGAFANYGYCKSPDDKHKLVVDDYAAEVVRGIFSLKLSRQLQTF